MNGNSCPRQLGEWAVLWTGFFLVFWIGTAFRIDGTTAYFAVHSVGGLVACTLLRFTRVFATSVFLIMIFVVAALLLGTRWLDERSFIGRSGVAPVVGLTLDGPVQSIALPGGVRRTWSVATVEDSAAVHVEVRAVELAAADEVWQPLDSGVQVDLAATNPVVWRIAAQGDSLRRVRYIAMSPTPISSAGLRVTVPYRLAHGTTTDRPVRLVVDDRLGRLSSSTVLRASDTWQLAIVSYPPSDERLGHALILSLTNLPETPIEVGAPLLETRDGDAWIPLPASRGIVITFGDFDHFVVPGLGWSSYEVPGTPSGTGIATVHLTLGTGNAVLVRSVRIDGLRSAKPLAASSRTSVLGLHPNLVAHTVAVVTAALIVTTRSRVGVATGTAAAAIAIALLGSRIALLGFALCLLLAAARHLRMSLVFGVSLAFTIGGGSLALITSSASFSRPADQQATARTDIWRSSWEALLGNGRSADEDSIPGLVSGATVDTTASQHAHNFWLELAAVGGYGGFAAAVWLTMGLLVISWWRGRRWYAALTAIALLLNIFDFTLFFSGVLLPLATALNLPAWAIGADQVASNRHAASKPDSSSVST